MNNLKLLFLFRLKNQMKISNLTNANKEVRKYAIYTISGYIAAFFMFLGYILFISIDVTMDNNMQAFFVLLSSILFWVFGIWNILSGPDDLIEAKDHDFIFSLPMKNWQAKLLPLFSRYMIHIFLTAIVLIFGYILTITYIHHFFFVLLLVLLLSFIIPFISINVTFLISLFVRYILTLLQWRNNVTEAMITLVLFVTPFIYFIRNTQSIDYKEALIHASILRFSLDEISSFHFLVNVILLIGIAVGTTFIVIFLLTAFHRFLYELKEKQPKRRNINTTWKVNSPFIALLSKEMKLYVSSLTYVSNTILTPVAIIVLNLCMLSGLTPNIHSFSYDINGFAITAQDIFTFIIFAFVILTTTTSCSLSFEGRSIWIMLVAPISTIKMALAKISINILLFLPGIVLTAIVYNLVFDVRILYLLAIVPLLCSTLLLISTVGFFINLYFPTYTWRNDMEVVKQSKATVITAIISMVIIPFIIFVAFLDHIVVLLLAIIIEIAIIIRMLLKVSRVNMRVNEV
ncbi:hypothetical protein KFZ56_18820 [Virgibacillus sp. NKC19-3]|uniref:hypothetical protein n=1 Tax=Virgibacillus saliphilus TaxID=2831674 RepID=UPI001C9ADC89|nr:hypothetical protein [Virgibacillus sp. NKC19-3]MBY7145074.1 hypothetical protein [Virgibacillus sp. NKC19-3]